MSRQIKYKFVFLICALISTAFTVLHHNLVPSHAVSFNGSYPLHFFLDTIFNTLLLYFTWLSITGVNIFLDRYFPWESKPRLRVSMQIILNTVISSLIIVSMIDGYSHLLHFAFPGPEMREQSSIKSIFVDNLNIITPGVFILYQIIYISIYIYRQWTKTLIEAEQLKKENLHSQLLALQNQVSPHFLFNSLNSLSMLIAENQTQAIEFVQELANVYRYLLQQHNESLIPLSYEMNFINSFLYLHRTRWGTGLQVETAIEKSNEEFLIAPTAMQLLVENALKHNIISSDRPLKIKIWTENNRINISNNLQKKLTDRPSSGIGLINIRERYRLLGYRDILISESDGEFRVSIPLINRQGTK